RTSWLSCAPPLRSASERRGARSSHGSCAPPLRSASERRGARSIEVVEQTVLVDAGGCAAADEPLGAEGAREELGRHGEEERRLGDLTGVGGHRRPLAVE